MILEKFGIELPPLRVVLDSQVWLRGMLAKEPDSIGSTILSAARNGVFGCVGSSALVYELGEKLRLPRIAKKLAPGQGAELLTIAIALMDPLVAIDGISMGCEDENDDHLLEAAVNGQAAYVVTRDEKLLDLPVAVRARLEANGDVIVIRDDHFCGIVRRLLSRGAMPR